MGLPSRLSRASPSLLPTLPEQWLELELLPTAPATPRTAGITQPCLTLAPGFGGCLKPGRVVLLKTEGCRVLVSNNVGNSRENQQEFVIFTSSSLKLQRGGAFSHQHTVQKGHPYVNIRLSGFPAGKTL